MNTTLIDGLCNAPSSFHRVTDKVFGDLKQTHSPTYFDDIITLGRQTPALLDNYEEILERLANAKFTLHPNKVEIGIKRVKVLGFIVEGGKIFPDPEYIEAITNFPVPKTVKAIQRFIGFVGWYRLFIPDYSQTCKPITNLLKSKTPFIWGPPQQDAFNRITSSITEITQLHLPDLRKPFTITTDGSATGLGAVLQQESDGIRYPVRFISRLLKDAETRYSASEIECLAVIWAVRKFQGYIEFTHFTIETDHRALTWLMKLKEPAGRLGRWKMELLGYDFDIVYRKGKSNIVADALSRSSELFYIRSSQAIPTSSMISEQKKCRELGLVYTYLLDNSLPTDTTLVQRVT
ncbi:unnamed protein product, partial [Allacma fusca]